MGKHILGPGGGALPTRSDEKMSNEKVRFWTGIDYREPAAKAFRKMQKRHSNKKRRQRDRKIDKDN